MGFHFQHKPEEEAPGRESRECHLSPTTTELMGVKRWPSRFCAGCEHAWWYGLEGAQTT